MQRVDAVAAGLLAVAAVGNSVADGHHAPLTLVAATVCTLTVAFRRRSPAASVAVAVGAITLFARSGGGTHLTWEPLAVLLDYYTLGRQPAAMRVAVDAGLLALALPAVVLSSPRTNVSDIAATWALFVVLPFAAGRAIRSRTALTRELRANAERLEREQEERAQRAAAEERNRIARELHDVVAHSVSVMVIQATAARRTARSDPQAAREALRSAENCGREALGELRRMTGVLRRGDAELAGTAEPGLAQLGALVGRARAAGLPVEVRTQGHPRELSPGVDLVAFRVVQEALTNVIKHAGPAHARVNVSYGERALELEVCDTGRGCLEPDGVGQGLVGMRERLTLFGGELRTGPRGPDGGYRVWARIPLGEAVAA